MPEYLAPGVYMEEIEIGAKPVEGVSTSTVAFLGKTERGSTKPRLITSFSDYVRYYGGYLDDSYLTYAVNGFFTNGGQRCYMVRILGKASLDSSLKLKGGENEVLVVKAAGSGVWGNNIYVKIADATFKDKNNSLFKIIIKYFRDPPTKDTDVKDETVATAEEVFDNVSPDSSDGAYYVKMVNGLSNLVVLLNTDKEGRPSNTPSYSKLTLGKDGGPIDLSAYKGVGNDYKKDVYFAKDNLVETHYQGLAELQKIDEISIVCAPDENQITGLRDELKSHCENLKDRFAILQASMTDAANMEKIDYGAESKYAAFYFPWIAILDPTANTPKLIPPGGHIAGIYARSDTNRGVHKAPANEVVRGILSLQVQIDKGQQGVLNPRGVNVIRSFTGRGPLVWGARTTTIDPLWKYVNVRRLFIFLEKSIERATQWVVFEPNNERLWARVKATITQFLTDVWRSGALMGTTAEEAFFVKCDRSTMTQNDIDNGRLIVLIGVAPTKPAEFVIFRLAQAKGGASVEEL